MMNMRFPWRTTASQCFQRTDVQLLRLCVSFLEEGSQGPTMDQPCKSRRWTTCFIQDDHPEKIPLPSHDDAPHLMFSQLVCIRSYLPATECTNLRLDDANLMD